MSSVTLGCRVHRLSVTYIIPRLDRILGRYNETHSLLNGHGMDARRPNRSKYIVLTASQSSTMTTGLTARVRKLPYHDH